MNDVTVYVVVEGQTEQTFIRDVLAPYIAGNGIYLNAALIGKPGHKGGDIKFERAKTDIGIFLRQRNDTYISTMFDYFRIDSEWPGLTEVRRKKDSGITLSAVDKAKILEDATREEIVRTYSAYNAANRFIPYIEMHEFEALLFSDVDILAAKAEIDILRLRKIIEKYNNNPEEINDDPDKAPGKRLIALDSSYRKVAMGKTISEAIGIQRIREKCDHFNSWLSILEKLKAIQ